MDKFSQNVISADQNARNRGLKPKPYFIQHDNMNLNNRPQQFSPTGMPHRSQQINPEFSEPFDLDSEYSKRMVPTLFRSTTANDYRKRQQIYARPKESDIISRQSPGQKPFQMQTMSQFYMPTFEPKHSYERSNLNYGVDIKEDHRYLNNKITSEFNSSVFDIDKKSSGRAENTFVVTNKNGDTKKTNVSKPPQSKNMKMSSSKRRCYFIGSIDQVIRWFRLTKQANIFAIFEISATLESIQKGKSPDKYVMFLRNESGFNSSVLQAVFFCIDKNKPTLQSGQFVTCVGRMIGANKLHIFDIWPNTLEEQAGVKRVSFLCQRTLQEATVSSSDSQ